MSVGPLGSAFRSGSQTAGDCSDQESDVNVPAKVGMDPEEYKKRPRSTDEEDEQGPTRPRESDD